jgi:hypothetical protein
MLQRALPSRLFSRRFLRPLLGRLNEFELQSNLQQRIASAMVRTDPYPYFVAENVLPLAVLQNVHGHWPNRTEFRPEIPHNYTCDLLAHRIADRGQRQFWDDFVKTHGRQIAIAGVMQFEPWIAARFQHDIEISLAWIGLMESDPSYAGHGCHTHHYHDPSWVGTLLFYLDENASGYPGTTIRRYSGASLGDQSKMAANTLQWFNVPEISEVTTVAYRQNRLFGFLDSPISYHSVHAAQPNAMGYRRIFRVHLNVPASAVERIYGVPYNKYIEQRKEPTEDPLVLAGLARDIEKMENCSRRTTIPKRSAN